MKAYDNAFYVSDTETVETMNLQTGDDSVMDLKNIIEHLNGKYASALPEEGDLPTAENFDKLKTYTDILTRLALSLGACRGSKDTASDRQEISIAFESARESIQLIKEINSDITRSLETVGSTNRKAA